MKRNKAQLLLTAILSFLFFALVFRMTAFMWFQGILIIGLIMILVSLSPIIALVTDRYFGTKLIYKALIVLIVFWVCFFAQQKIKSVIEESIELKAAPLISKIENYKDKNGVYPSTLSSAEFQEYDYSTLIGTKFIYSSNNDSTYTIKYSSFDGGSRYYENDQDWYWND